MREWIETARTLSHCALSSVSRVLRCGSGLKQVHQRRFDVLRGLPRLTMREWIETYRADVERQIEVVSRVLRCGSGLKLCISNVSLLSTPSPASYDAGVD